jgi:hypothetical protein
MVIRISQRLAEHLWHLSLPDPLEMVEREEGGRREERREGEGKRGGKIQRRQ